MRFDRGRVEWSPREKLVAGIVLGLGAVLIVPTRGILLALGALGLLTYYGLQGAQSEEEHKKLPQLEARINVLEDQVRPWRALDEYMPRRVQREFQNLYITLKNDIEKGLKYWADLVTPFKGRLIALVKFLQTYNGAYFTRQEALHADFFNGKEYGAGKPFNPQQIRAILTNNYHTVVVAGPGAGKTQVITGRVAFFVHKKHVPPGKICVLAFNNSAAHEVRERLQRIYSITGVAVHTFHGLGHQIIRASMPRPVDIESHSEKILQSLLQTLLDTDPAYLGRFLEYIAIFMSNQRFHPPQDMSEELYAQRAGERYAALDGTGVKSIAERDIANFFIRHGISYEYEHRADWCDPDPMDPRRTYHPDFYLPQWDIYLEHWALNDAGAGILPPWFEGGARKYRAGQQWKRVQFHKHRKTLWETSYDDWKAGQLESKLTNYLSSNGIVAHALSYNVLLEKLHLRGNRPNILKNDLVQTISTAKTLGFSTTTLQVHMEFIRQSSGVKPFVLRYYDLVLPLFIAYEHYLQAAGKIDFADMINLATKTLQDKRAVLQDAGYAFQMIFVDEYQDVSLQRVQFLQALMPLDPGCHLFCVGDDWQAIYGFTGASAKYMVDFERYFPEPVRVDLNLNYRNYHDVLQLGADVIANCQVKLAKSLRAVKGYGGPPTPTPLPAITLARTIVPPGGNPTPNVDFIALDAPSDAQFRDLQAKQVTELIDRLLKDGVDPAEIMVLSRFTFGYRATRVACETLGSIPVEVAKEESVIHRGVQFSTIHRSKGTERDHVIILNANSVLFGFPPQIPSSFSLRVLSPDLASELDEERRLFFVAVTRARKKVYLFAWAQHESEFLLENATYQARQGEAATTVAIRGTLVEEDPAVLHIRVQESPNAVLAPGSVIRIPRRLLYSPIAGDLHQEQNFYVPRVWLKSQIIPISNNLQKVPKRPRSPVDSSRQANIVHLKRIKEKYPQAYTPWTTAADEDLTRRFQAGETTAALASHFQRQPSAIRSRLRKLGLVAGYKP